MSCAVLHVLTCRNIGDAPSLSGAWNTGNEQRRCCSSCAVLRACTELWHVLLLLLCHRSEALAATQRQLEEASSRAREAEQQQLLAAAEAARLQQQVGWLPVRWSGRLLVCSCCTCRSRCEDTSSVMFCAQRAACLCACCPAGAAAG